MKAAAQRGDTERKCLYHYQLVRIDRVATIDVCQIKESLTKMVLMQVDCMHAGSSEVSHFTDNLEAFE